MTDRILTPSKITAWLECAHYLTLQERKDAGLLKVESGQFGNFARLLTQKGLQHEGECLQHYRAVGRTVYEVPQREVAEPFAHWVARVGTPWDEGHDVISQMPFIHDGMRGIADFLVKVDNAAPGACAYEPVDAKLARTEAKPGHVLQLCFYADALTAASRGTPERLHIWLGSGRIESLGSRDFQPYWRRLRSLLRQLMENGAPQRDTRPEPCDHCDFCDFADVCQTQWREEDSLVFVYGARPAERSDLEAEAVATMAELANRTGPVDAIRPKRLERLVTQATLQVEARDNPDEPPPWRPIKAGEDMKWGRGLELIPAPDEGDVFLDFEGDPFWRTDRGLFFLFGMITKDSGATWNYRSIWSHDVAGEERSTRELIEFFAERRRSHPDMHVYHFNHTERSALESLSAEHGAGEALLAELVATGCFVDLLPVVRNGIQVGTESYGLKQLERLAGYQRSHDIDRGSAAVVEYERYMVAPDAAILGRIAAYNEDDVRATLALRDWLVDRRPEGMDWRAAWLDPEEVTPELDLQIAALHAHGSGTPQHLLGDLLGYWTRERRANKAPKLEKTSREPSTLLDEPDVITGLEHVGMETRIGAKGRELTPGARFRWPEQEVAEGFDHDRAKVLFGAVDGSSGSAGVLSFDPKSLEMLLLWNERSQELGTYPGSVALDDWVPPNPKPDALSAFAAGVLGGPGPGALNPPSMSLLRRESSRFTAGNGPSGGEFADDLTGMTKWIEDLDGSYVSVQGPPGTGKTYWGAHIVHSLIATGHRVGITAMSHPAIDNLLAEILQVFGHKGELSKLRAVRRQTGSANPLVGVEYAAGNSKCAKPEFNLVAGTTWLFAGQDMRDAPVDVLIVDEAGQLALADALAASMSARNLVLLGDPLQLPQVSQAVHPEGAGNSVLEHVLGEDVTLPPDRGVFLTETRRMHPDVCRFISEQIYEGRLRSHPDCAQQNTEFGTGLRWLRAEHADRSTESIEEAEFVRGEIERMIGTPWVDQHGVEAPLEPEDFMVVAPYNDQVALLRQVLDAEDRTSAVPVGTVDKFQGREAAVVFFTMTTSSSEDMPRTAQFLFSRNRLNVAISRARCLAFLVCTEELLNSRARSIEEMRLISTLCSFVEYCSVGPDPHP